MTIVLDKKKLQILEIVLLLVLIFLIMVPANMGRKVNAEIMFFFALNGVWWFVLFLRALKRNPYSLEIMHWVFFLFFFFFAALVQYLNDSFPWGVSLEDSTILKANMLLSVWTACVLAGEKISDKMVLKKRASYKVFEGERFFMPLLVMTLVNVWSVGFRIYEVGLWNVLSRGTNSGIRYVDYGSLSMLISECLQAVSYFSVVLSILSWKKNKKARYLFFIVVNAAFTVIGYFPTGMARYAVAVIYMGLLLTFSDKMKKNRSFMVLFIVAYVVILPMLNSWRTAAISEASLGAAFLKVFENFSSLWLANDYDAFTLYAMSIDHIAKYGAGGNHLLSILFFWVPRAWWPGKALSGSYEMAVSRGLGFTNLSCPFPAEGILDGGVTGLVLFGIFIGILMRILDEGYWRNYDENKNVIRQADLIYPVLVIFFFFMCRGDMFYTFAYLVSYIFVWFVIINLTKKSRVK